MTLPYPSDLTARERVKRLAQFTRELNALGDAPSRATLERLIRRVAELGLPEDDVLEDLAQLRACIEAIDMRDRLSRGEFPTAEAADLVAPGEACHFVAPVRFGRRRVDQFGHLVLSNAALTFRGALDVSVAWSEITSVRRHKRELLVTLQDSARILRFSCHSHVEAARGGVIAEYFAQRAHEDPTRTFVPHHASV